MEGSRAMTVPAELTEEAVRQALRQVKDPELDMPARELSDSGEPGAVVWDGLGACDGLERRAAAQHARLEPQLLGDAVARRLETLDARLDARVAGWPGSALHPRQVRLVECQR